MEGVNEFEELKRIVREEGWDAICGCSECGDIKRKTLLAYCGEGRYCDEYHCWPCAMKLELFVPCFVCNALICRSCHEKCGENGCKSAVCYPCYFANALENRCQRCYIVCDEHQKNHKH